MTGLEIWLLAIGLAMDCFAVSIASGIILKRTRWKPMLVMAFAFGFFQAIMPFIGWMCAKTFSHLIESVDHWIAFAILAFLGGRMILESFKEEECCKLFNPANPKVVLTMAIATSIDALAIGISFAFLGVQDYTEILPPISIIGFVSFCHVTHRSDLWYPMWLRHRPETESRVMGRYHSSHYRTKDIN